MAVATATARMPLPLPPPATRRLTDLADGQVLSVTVWHMLSDAGRAISLASRLAAYYR